MELNLSAFQEPRGVMRIFHFIFAICAFATTTDYSGFVKFLCRDTLSDKFEYSYPFLLIYEYPISKCQNGSNEVINIAANLSSDSQFFVATGVLSMLYVLGAIFIYAKYDEQYKNNARWPLVDFVMTVILAILWLSGSAAWANGLNGLKLATSPNLKKCDVCTIITSSVSTLTISVILGFLNFFLWASDLWFLYKETEWFQQKQPADAASPNI